MSRSTGDHRCTSELFLLFCMEGDRYALDARGVVEVLPLLHLKRIPETPEWVAGVFSHHDVLVPVLNLCTVVFGHAALTRTNTHTVLTEYRVRQERKSVWLGLILGRATDTLRYEPPTFRGCGLDNGGARYLGPVCEGPRGLTQWVRVKTLLPDEVRALLLPPECGKRAA